MVGDVIIGMGIMQIITIIVVEEDKHHSIIILVEMAQGILSLIHEMITMATEPEITPPQKQL